MNRLLPRTSITLDEAVAILLGHASGPIEIEPFDENEEAEANCPAFSLDYLEDERDVLEGEYELAKHERRSANDVAEKLEALKHQQAILDQANDHLCAIEDELNKGEHSMLRVDRELSNAAYTYITLHSFKEWVERRGSVSAGAADAETPSATSAAPTAVVTKRAHGTRLLDRKDAIFAEIAKRGLNPKALPKLVSGKAGLRSEIRDALQTSPLFKGSEKLFDHAWAGLFKKDDERLAYEE
jgi:hypothetical protein